MNETYKITIKTEEKTISYVSRSTLKETLNAIYYDYPKYEYVEIESIRDKTLIRQKRK